MTTKEAIMILESIQPSCGEKYSFSESEIYEAIDMAIEALSSSEIPNSSDTIYRQDAIKVARDWYEGLICGSFKGLEKRLRALPPAQPEIIRCKDCKHSKHWYKDKRRCFLWHEEGIDVFEDGYCNYAKRRTRGEQDENYTRR